MRKKIRFPSYLLENNSNIYTDPIYSVLKHKLQIKAKPFPNTQKIINTKFKNHQNKIDAKNTANCTSIVPVNNMRSVSLMQNYFQPVKTHILNPSFITSLHFNPIQHGQSNFPIVPYVPPLFVIPKTKRYFADYQIKTQEIKSRNKFVVRHCKKISLRPLIPKFDQCQDYTEDYISLRRYKVHERRIRKINRRRQNRENLASQRLFLRFSDITPDDDNPPLYIYSIPLN